MRSIMGIVIRPEQQADIEAIAEVNRLAFGRDEEARLVAAIRAIDAFVPELSLVACDNNRIIGHILFSKMHIETPKGLVDALSLAPLAVIPDYQRKGVGAKLIERGIEASRNLGHKMVIVVGHAEYYPKFGFKRAGNHGLEAPFEVPPEAFMVLELIPNALKGVSGTIRYSKAFDAFL